MKLWYEDELNNKLAELESLVDRVCTFPSQRHCDCIAATGMAKITSGQIEDESQVDAIIDGISSRITNDRTVINSTKAVPCAQDESEPAQRMCKADTNDATIISASSNAPQPTAKIGAKSIDKAGVIDYSKWQSLDENCVAAVDPAHLPRSVESPSAQILRLKALGNQHFGSGDHQTAIQAYTDALSILEQTPTAADSKTHATLLSNRAQAFLRTKDASAALKDADVALALDSGNIKTTGRKISALSLLERWQDIVDLSPRIAGMTSDIDQILANARTKLSELRRKELSGSKEDVAMVEHCVQQIISSQSRDSNRLENQISALTTWVDRAGSLDDRIWLEKLLEVPSICSSKLFVPLWKSVIRRDLAGALASHLGTIISAINNENDLIEFLSECLLCDSFWSGAKMSTNNTSQMTPVGDAILKALSSQNAASYRLVCDLISDSERLFIAFKYWQWPWDGVISALIDSLAVTTVASECSTALNILMATTTDKSLAEIMRRSDTIDRMLGVLPSIAAKTYLPPSLLALYRNTLVLSDNHRQHNFAPIVSMIAARLIDITAFEGGEREIGVIFDILSRHLLVDSQTTMDLILTSVRTNQKEQQGSELTVDSQKVNCLISNIVAALSESGTTLFLYRLLRIALEWKSLGRNIVDALISNDLAGRFVLVLHQVSGQLRSKRRPTDEIDDDEMKQLKIAANGILCLSEMTDLSTEMVNVAKKLDLIAVLIDLLRALSSLPTTLTKTTAVTTLQKNVAILCAKLSRGDPSLLQRVRSLQGLELMYALGSKLVIN